MTRLTDVDRARALLCERDGELRLNIRGDVAALALAFRAIRRESRAAPGERDRRYEACHAEHVRSENMLASARRFANHYRRALEVLAEESRKLARAAALGKPWDACDLYSLSEFAEKKATDAPPLRAKCLVCETRQAIGEAARTVGDDNRCGVCAEPRGSERRADAAERREAVLRRIATEVVDWIPKLLSPGGLNPPGYCPPLERLRAVLSQPSPGGASSPSRPDDEPVSERLTEGRIAELERLEREATPGPWRTGRSDMVTLSGDEASPYYKNVYVSDPRGGTHQGRELPYIVGRGQGDEDECRANAALFAAARNALPALLAEVRASRAAPGERDRRYEACHAEHVRSENMLASARRFANHYRRALEVIAEEAEERASAIASEGVSGPDALSYVHSVAQFAAKQATSEPPRDGGEVAFPLPPEVVEILRDVATGPCMPDLRGRAGAALVRRDLVDACQRCGGSGYERVNAGPGANAWGACEVCRAARSEGTADTGGEARDGSVTCESDGCWKCPRCARMNAPWHGTCRGACGYTPEALVRPAPPKTPAPGECVDGPKCCHDECREERYFRAGRQNKPPTTPAPGEDA